MDTTSAGRSSGTVVPYRARASVEGKRVAESEAAVRVDRPGAAPLLWFPRADVDPEALDPLDADAWQAGDGDLANHVAFDLERVDLVARRRRGRRRRARHDDQALPDLG